MPSTGFNIRLSASNVAAVEKALESVGKSGESALKQIERSSKAANDQGLKAFNKGLSEGQYQAQAYARQLGPLGAGLTALGPAGLAAAAGIALVGGGLFKAVTAADAWEREQLKINALLKTTQQASGQTGRSIEDLAQRIGRETLASTEDVRAAAAALLTFRSVSGDAFGRTLEVAQDLSAVLGTDLRSSVVQLGKALEDPERNLSQLNRSGISFTATQVDMVKALKDSGREAEALSEVLGIIEGQVGGAGKAEASGLAGGIDTLNEALRRFLERAGAASGVGSVLDSLARAGAAVIDAAADAQRGGGIPDTRSELLKRRDELFSSLAGLREVDFAAGQRELADVQAKLREIRLEEEGAAAAAKAAAEHRHEEAEAAKAQAEAEKAASAAAKARDSARQSALVQIAKLEESAAQAGLDGISLLAVKRDQALDDYTEQKGKELGLEEEFSKARLAIEEKFQKDKADIEKDAAEKARREAEAEAKKIADKAEREAEKTRKEQEREAEKQAELMEAPFKHAQENIQDAFTDTFESILDGGVNTFEDVADAAKKIFIKLAAELATLQLFQGGLGGSLGLSPSASAASLGQNAGGATVAGAGLSGLFDGSIFERLFGSTEDMATSHIVGGRAGGVGTPGVAGGFYNAGSTGGFFDNFSLGSLLGNLGLGFGAGAAANSLLGPLIGGGNATGGAIGGLVGAIPGLILGGPLGAALGGALGGIVGGLFGPGPSVGPNSGAAFTVKDGKLQVREAGADNGGSAANAQRFGDEVANAVNAIIGELGGALTGRGISGVGEVGGNFFVSTANSYSAKSAKKFGADYDAATTYATLQTLQKAGLSGLTPETEEALRRAARVSDDLQDFAANLEVARAILDDSLFDSKDISAAQQALDDLNDQFKEASERAERLGLSVEKVAELRDKALADLTEGFDKGIRQQILQITDPVTAALEAQAEVARERLDNAKTLGADLVEVERLNALERQQVLDQAAGDLTSFFREITYGGLSGISPAGSVEAQRAAFEAAAASGNVSQLSSLGRGLLDSARGAYASGPQYQEILSRVQSVVGGYVSANDPGIAGTLNEGFGTLASQGATMSSYLEQILRRIEDLLDENQRLNSQLKAATV